MDVLYTVTMSYPDGHLEEIEEVFNSLEQAKEYGERMLNYVASTESIKRGGGLFDDDDFRSSRQQEPYFMVIRLEGKERKIVFESRR